MSSIARAFTLRSKKSQRNNTTSEVPAPSPVPSTSPARMNSQHQSASSFRSGTYQGPGKHVNRILISAPTFVATTNTYALNAPDISTIKGLRKASSSISSGSSSRNSGDDSDVSSVRTGSRDTQLTDASSVDNSPSGSPNLRESNSFANNPKLRTSTLAGRSRSSYDLRSRVVSTADPSPDVPQIPMRAPSHSKRAHEQLHRKRSLQQVSSFVAAPAPTPAPIAAQQQRSSQMPKSTTPQPQPQNSNREQRVSLDMFKANVTELAPHPFGPELAQLDAVAEDFNNFHRDADISIMRERRLVRFCAEDYILDIQPLFQRCFGPPMIQVDPVGGWI